MGTIKQKRPTITPKRDLFQVKQTCSHGITCIDMTAPAHLSPNCLLLQDLVDSYAQGGRRIVEDM